MLPISSAHQLPPPVCADQPVSFSQGFAYLEFADEASLQAALQLSGTQLNQYALNVFKSQPPGSRGGAAGRSGSGDGAGRGGFAPGRGQGGRQGGRGRGSEGGRSQTPAGGGRPGRGIGGAPGGGPRPRMPADAPHMDAASGAPRQRLLPGGGAPAMAFVPRSVSAAKTPGKGPPAKSNADFRSMFLGKGAGAQ